MERFSCVCPVEGVALLAIGVDAVVDDDADHAVVSAGVAAATAV